MEGAFDPAHDVGEPLAVVDGGGEEWPVLGNAIQRRMEQLPPGGILEVLSGQRRSRADIPTWCFLSGHELVQMWTDRDATRFWIRKGRT